MLSPTGMKIISLLMVVLQLGSSAPVQETSVLKRLPGRTPRMQGCYYNSAHFENGERIVTNEPCLNCTCIDSTLMCFLRVCPFVKPLRETCVEVKNKEDCCPKVYCNENEKKNDSGGKNAKKETRGCYLEDKYYPDGAMLPQDPKNPCEVCYCIRNSTSCVVQECELKVEGCSPVYKPGQCCPCRYNCTYEETTTVPPGFTVSDLSEGCYLADGRFVEDGEAVNSSNPCEHCYCMRNEMVCAIQECQAPGDNCTPIAPKPGQCCPEKYDCPAATQNEAFASPETSSPAIAAKFPVSKKGYSPKPPSIKGIGIKTVPSQFKPVGLKQVGFLDVAEPTKTQLPTTQSDAYSLSTTAEEVDSKVQEFDTDKVSDADEIAELQPTTSVSTTEEVIDGINVSEIEKSPENDNVLDVVESVEVHYTTTQPDALPSRDISEEVDEKTIGHDGDKVLDDATVGVTTEVQPTKSESTPEVAATEISELEEFLEKDYYDATTLGNKVLSTLTSTKSEQDAERSKRNESTEATVLETTSSPIPVGGISIHKEIETTGISTITEHSLVPEEESTDKDITGHQFAAEVSPDESITEHHFATEKAIPDKDITRHYFTTEEVSPDKDNTDHSFTTEEAIPDKGLSGHYFTTEGSPDNGIIGHYFTTEGGISDKGITDHNFATEELITDKAIEYPVDSVKSNGTNESDSVFEASSVSYPESEVTNDAKIQTSYAPFLYDTSSEIHITETTEEAVNDLDKIKVTPKSTAEVEQATPVSDAMEELHDMDTSVQKIGILPDGEINESYSVKTETEKSTEINVGDENTEEIYVTSATRPTSEQPTDVTGLKISPTHPTEDYGVKNVSQKPENFEDSPIHIYKIPGRPQTSIHSTTQIPDSRMKLPNTSFVDEDPSAVLSEPFAVASLSDETVHKPTSDKTFLFNVEDDGNTLKMPDSTLKITGPTKNVVIPEFTGTINTPQVSYDLEIFKPHTGDKSPSYVSPLKLTGVNGKTPNVHDVTRGQLGSRRRPNLPIGAIPGEIISGMPLKQRPAIKVTVPAEGICRVGKKVYQNGQSMEPTGICKTNCQCINRVVYCDDIVCPAPPCDKRLHCVKSLKKDQCCPHYDCRIVDSQLGTEEVTSSTLTHFTDGTATASFGTWTELTDLESSQTSDSLEESTFQTGTLPPTESKETLKTVELRPEVTIEATNAFSDIKSTIISPSSVIEKDGASTKTLTTGSVFVEESPVKDEKDEEIYSLTEETRPLITPTRPLDASASDTHGTDANPFVEAGGKVSTQEPSDVSDHHISDSSEELSTDKEIEEDVVEKTEPVATTAQTPDQSISDLQSTTSHSFPVSETDVSSTEAVTAESTSMETKPTVQSDKDENLEIVDKTIQHFTTTHAPDISEAENAGVHASTQDEPDILLTEIFSPESVMFTKNVPTQDEEEKEIPKTVEESTPHSPTVPSSGAPATDVKSAVAHPSSTDEYGTAVFGTESSSSEKVTSVVEENAKEISTTIEERTPVITELPTTDSAVTDVKSSVVYSSLAAETETSPSGVFSTESISFEKGLSIAEEEEKETLLTSEHLRPFEDAAVGNVSESNEASLLPVDEDDVSAIDAFISESVLFDGSSTENEAGKEMSSTEEPQLLESTQVPDASANDTESDTSNHVSANETSTSPTETIVIESTSLEVESSDEGIEETLQTVEGERPFEATTKIPDTSVSDKESTTQSTSTDVDSDSSTADEKQKEKYASTGMTKTAVTDAQAAEFVRDTESTTDYVTKDYDKTTSAAETERSESTSLEADLSVESNKEEIYIVTEVTRPFESTLQTLNAVFSDGDVLKSDIAPYPVPENIILPTESFEPNLLDTKLSTETDEEEIHRPPEEVRPLETIKTPAIYASETESTIIYPSSVSKIEILPTELLSTKLNLLPSDTEDGEKEKILYFTKVAQPLEATSQTPDVMLSDVDGIKILKDGIKSSMVTETDIPYSTKYTSFEEKTPVQHDTEKVTYETFADIRPLVSTTQEQDVSESSTKSLTVYPSSVYGVDVSASESISTEADISASESVSTEADISASESISTEADISASESVSTEADTSASESISTEADTSASESISTEADISASESVSTEAGVSASESASTEVGVSVSETVIPEVAVSVSDADTSKVLFLEGHSTTEYDTRKETSATTVRTSEAEDTYVSQTESIDVSPFEISSTPDDVIVTKSTEIHTSEEEIQTFETTKQEQDILVSEAESTTDYLSPKSVTGVSSTERSTEGTTSFAEESLTENEEDNEIVKILERKPVTTHKPDISESDSTTFYSSETAEIGVSSSEASETDSSLFVEDASIKGEKEILSTTNETILLPKTTQTPSIVVSHEEGTTSSASYSSPAAETAFSSTEIMTSDSSSFEAEAEAFTEKSTSLEEESTFENEKFTFTQVTTKQSPDKKEFDMKTTSVHSPMEIVTTTSPSEIFSTHSSFEEGSSIEDEKTELLSSTEEQKPLVTTTKTQVIPQDDTESSGEYPYQDSEADALPTDISIAYDPLSAEESSIKDEKDKEVLKSTVETKPFETTTQKTDISTDDIETKTLSPTPILETGVSSTGESFSLSTSLEKESTDNDVQKKHTAEQKETPSTSISGESTTLTVSSGHVVSIAETYTTIPTLSDDEPTEIETTKEILQTVNETNPFVTTKIPGSSLNETEDENIYPSLEIETDYVIVEATNATAIEQDSSAENKKTTGITKTTEITSPPPTGIVIIDDEKSTYIPSEKETDIPSTEAIITASTVFQDETASTYEVETLQTTNKGQLTTTKRPDVVVFGTEKITGHESFTETDISSTEVFSSELSSFEDKMPTEKIVSTSDKNSIAIVTHTADTGSDVDSSTNLLSSEAQKVYIPEEDSTPPQSDDAITKTTEVDTEESPKPTGVTSMTTVDKEADVSTTIKSITLEEKSNFTEHLSLSAEKPPKPENLIFSFNDTIFFETSNSSETPLLQTDDLVKDVSKLQPSKPAYFGDESLKRNVTIISPNNDKTTIFWATVFGDLKPVLPSEGGLANVFTIEESKTESIVQENTKPTEEEKVSTESSKTPLYKDHETALEEKETEYTDATTLSENISTSQADISDVSEISSFNKTTDNSSEISLSDDVSVFPAASETSEFSTANRDLSDVTRPVSITTDKISEVTFPVTKDIVTSSSNQDTTETKVFEEATTSQKTDDLKYTSETPLESETQKYTTTLAPSTIKDSDDLDIKSVNQFTTSVTETTPSFEETSTLSSSVSTDITKDEKIDAFSTMTTFSDARDVSVPHIELIETDISDNSLASGSSLSPIDVESQKLPHDINQSAASPEEWKSTIPESNQSDETEENSSSSEATSTSTKPTTLSSILTSILYEHPSVVTIINQLLSDSFTLEDENKTEDGIPGNVQHLGNETYTENKPDIETYFEPVETSFSSYDDISVENEESSAPTSSSAEAGAVSFSTDSSSVGDILTSTSIESSSTQYVKDFSKSDESSLSIDTEEPRYPVESFTSLSKTNDITDPGNNADLHSTDLALEESGTFNGIGETASKNFSTASSTTDVDDLAFTFVKGTTKEDITATDAKGTKFSTHMTDAAETKTYTTSSSTSADTITETMSGGSTEVNVSAEEDITDISSVAGTAETSKVPASLNVILTSTNVPGDLTFKYVTSTPAYSTFPTTDTSLFSKITTVISDVANIFLDDFEHKSISKAQEQGAETVESAESTVQEEQSDFMASDIFDALEEGRNSTFLDTDDAVRDEDFGEETNTSLFDTDADKNFVFLANESFVAHEGPEKLTTQESISVSGPTSYSTKQATETSDKIKTTHVTRQPGEASHEFDTTSSATTISPEKPEAFPSTLSTSETFDESHNDTDVSNHSSIYGALKTSTSKPGIKTKYPVSTPEPGITYTLQEEIMKEIAMRFPSSPPTNVYEVHSPTKPDFTISSHGRDVCYYGGKVYLTSEQIPQKDNCEFCFCFKGDVICLQQTCPPPIAGCYSIPIDGFCCPRFHCPVQQLWLNGSFTPYTTTTTTSYGIISQKALSHLGCEIGGQMYRLGQIVRPASNACMVCRCDYGGIMKCDPRACKPKESMLQQIVEEFTKKK